jgi:hypothetical protein
LLGVVHKEELTVALVTEFLIFIIFFDDDFGAVSFAEAFSVGAAGDLFEF